MTGTPLSCHRSISIVADGRLEVCDGAHWAFVMKKSQRPRPSLRDRTGHPPFTLIEGHPALVMRPEESQQFELDCDLADRQIVRMRPLTLKKRERVGRPARRQGGKSDVNTRRGRGRFRGLWENPSPRGGHGVRSIVDRSPDIFPCVLLGQCGSGRCTKSPPLCRILYLVGDHWIWSRSLRHSCNSGKEGSCCSARLSTFGRSCGHVVLNSLVGVEVFARVLNDLHEPS
jgi:hypothetical protein